jgi:hypothetical protein
MHLLSVKGKGPKDPGPTIYTKDEIALLLVRRHIDEDLCICVSKLCCNKMQELAIVRPFHVLTRTP